MKKLNTEELNRIDIDEFKKTKKTPIVVVLDNIRSLNNVGSVFRTSDAFLIEAIYLCGITAQPPHKDIHKTALGATESVAWQYFNKTEDAIKTLKAKNYLIASVEQTENSVKLQNLSIDKKQAYAIVLGHEVKGVEQAIINQSDFVIEVPQYGTKHSFNISVTTGIVLWEMFKQFKY